MESEATTKGPVEGEATLQVSLEMGVALAESGRYEEALDTFNQITEANPEDAEAWYNKGVALYRLGRARRALDSYDQATEVNPLHAKAWYNKGVILNGLGRQKKALIAFDKAAEVNPQYGQAYNNKGVILDELGMCEEALAAFDRAIDTNSEYAKAWNNKGSTLYRLGRHTEALTAFNRATRVNPMDAQAWNSKSVALTQLGRHSEALDACNKATKTDPQYAEAWYNKGGVLYRLGRYSEALAAFDKATEIDQQFARAWGNKSSTLTRLGQHQEALSAANTSIEIDSQDASAYSNLAGVLINLGSPDQAISHVNQAIALDGNLTPALLLRGMIEIERKEYAKASQSFAEAIPADLGNPLPLLWNAYARYLTAESSYQPDNRAYQQELTDILRQLERAEELLKKDETRLRTYTLYALGCLHFKLKDMVEAVRVLKKCISQRTGASIKSSARELLGNIWSYAIKPSLWRWWLGSPLHSGLKKTVFSVTAFLVPALLVGYIYLTAYFPTLRVELPLIAAVIILLVILALPLIERIRAKDFEVELPPPPPMEPVLSPAMMEMKSKDLESNSQQ